MLVLGAMACGGTKPGADACEGSETRACQCADGAWSVRQCHSQRFGACECKAASLVDAAADAAQAASMDAASDAGVRPDAEVQASEAGALDAAKDAAADADTTCGEQHSQAVIAEERPVDVIFIIDNSGSMAEEIHAVERNINQSFAQIIAESGADYRVIMITEHGSGTYEVCVEPPLAGAPCSVTGSGAPANTQRFHHYDTSVYSNDSICVMLQHYADTAVGPDGGVEITGGWGSWLREEALKVFVEITDDRVSCSIGYGDPSTDFTSAYGTPSTTEATQLARKMHQAILGLSEAQFGTPAAPKFVWHSLVGIANNDPVDLPYTHLDPPRFSGRCPTAVNAGPAYQMLSISTGGLRYPVCAADQGYGYDAVFRAIAHEVVRGSNVECAFNIPSAPAGKFVDLETVAVKYTPGTGGALEVFDLVDEAACDDASFYFGDAEIKLCPATCERVRADSSGSIDVAFHCGPQRDAGIL